jgi:hypothetical protein
MQQVTGVSWLSIAPKVHNIDSDFGLLMKRKQKKGKII